MKQLLRSIRLKPLSILILAIPLAILAEISHWGEVWVFVLSALGIVPMAKYIGEATEALADYTGPRIGGLLNATLGNTAELIITIVAIRAGLLELVKASITGSILGNLLLVMGLSMVLGGIRHGLQTFDSRQATRNAILLILAVLALVILRVQQLHWAGNQSPRRDLKPGSRGCDDRALWLGVVVQPESRKRPPGSRGLWKYRPQRCLVGA